MKTWQFELAAVATILVTVTSITATRVVDWIALAAVLVSFCHGQVSDRLAAEQSRAIAPSVECHALAGRYWFAKEALWLTYFLIQRSYAAVVGAVIFAAYPAWRTWWRKP